MFGYQLQALIDKITILNGHFKGIFSIDNVPSTIDTASFIIVNTDFSFNLGKHWILCYRSGTQKYEIFDPLASITKRTIQTYFQYNGTCYFNVTPIQPINSKLCGVFCLYVITIRLFNLDESFLETLNCIFCESLCVNEKLVSKFLKRVNNNNFLVNAS